MLISNQQYLLLSDYKYTNQQRIVTFWICFSRAKSIHLQDFMAESLPSVNKREQ